MRKEEKLSAFAERRAQERKAPLFSRAGIFIGENRGSKLRRRMRPPKTGFVLLQQGIEGLKDFSNEGVGI